MRVIGATPGTRRVSGDRSAGAYQGDGVREHGDGMGAGGIRAGRVGHRRFGAAVSLIFVGVLVEKVLDLMAPSASEALGSSANHR